MYDDKNYEDVARKIRNLGGRFKGRLSDLSLFSVLDYLDHNEPELASQILISYLVGP